MKQYLDILRNILENGTPKQPVRVGADGVAIAVENGTTTTFCEIFRHDMSKGFPLLTTKFVSLKTIAVELEFFIKGLTCKQWLKDRKCNIWNEWANPQAVEEAIKDCEQRTQNLNYVDARKELQKILVDLGAAYGFQWRHFDQHYTYESEDWQATFDKAPNGVAKGFDQLKYIADTLRSNPYDRRMVCSAWNMNQKHITSLPPCHYAWNVVVVGNKLNLVWNQRSVDTKLGLPYNIASYALLLTLLANHANLELGELVGTLHDCHLYDNHLEQAKEQLSREPKKLPKVEIWNNTYEQECDETYLFNIFEWTSNQFNLHGYEHHPAIKAEITV